jgi:hypothetical protein
MILSSAVPVLALALVCPLLTAQGEGERLLRAVRVERDGAATVILIEADGSLPDPKVGSLESPPRVYLDFAGLTPATAGVRQPDGVLVRGVRVALFQAMPLTTRVVIDLAHKSTYRVDTSELEAGRVRILLDGATDSTVPAPETSVSRHDPGPALPPLAPLGARPEPPALSPQDDIAILQRLRPVLASIDARAHVAESSLRDALVQLEEIRLRVSKTAGGVHETLAKVCAFGKAAVSDRIEAQRSGDGARAWTAASAAAGALILLDQVTAAPRAPVKK